MPKREACEAYIKSQAHEGWRPIPGRYDDSAFSGASLNSPALQTLLVDIETGKIDIIVVYKVDRLTRSLADFANSVAPTIDVSAELNASLPAHVYASFKLAGSQLGEPTVSVLRARRLKIADQRLASEIRRTTRKSESVARTETASGRHNPRKCRGFAHVAEI